MRHIALHEYSSLYRGSGDLSSGDRRGGRRYLSELHFRRLQRYDQRRAATKSRQIFKWHHGYAVAQQWVGVVQVPGLTIEILPKIAPQQVAGGSDVEEFSRKNLMYMLVVAGEVPLRERDLATQSTSNTPLLETLIAIFADRLYFELNRGQQRAYIRRRENLSMLKGKLAFSQHLKHNLARRDRFFVDHDQYSADTPLNRIFKAACRLLFELTSTPNTEERLGYCLMLLDQVTDITVATHHFDSIILNRQNDRFADLFEFCLLLFANNSPTAQAGTQNTFSLLFDMNEVYEKFTARFFRKYVLRDDLSDCRLHTHSPPRTQHLVYQAPDERPTDYTPRANGKKVLRLLPDIIIEREDQRLLIDTKWIHLSKAKNPRYGVSRNVLFQLFAYAYNYDAHHNVLLYPKPRDPVPEQTFDLPLQESQDSPRSIHSLFADLNRDLTSRSHRRSLTTELHDLVDRLLPAQK